MDPQQQLFGLMTVAEEHQKAVQAAIDGLTAERTALARERAILAQAAVTAGPLIQKAAGEAVRAELDGAANLASDALNQASDPIIRQLSGVVKVAAEAEDKLKGAVAAFGWKWMVVAGSAATGAILAVLLAAWLSIWWQRGEIESLTEQRQVLLEDIGKMQATVAALEKRGGKIIMNTCGGRLCIEASTNQGEGMTDWAGPWKSDKGIPLVIPRGH